MSTLKVTYITEETYKVQMGGWLATDAPRRGVVARRRAHGVLRAARPARRPVVGLGRRMLVRSIVRVGQARRRTYNGKQYAAPLGYDAYGFFYRKDLFDKAGIKANPKPGMNFSMPARC